MAESVYEFISTKNARLAKFTDQHPNVAEVLMKVVVHLEQISRERGRSLEQEQFECKASPDGRLVLIRIRS